MLLLPWKSCVQFHLYVSGRLLFYCRNSWNTRIPHSPAVFVLSQSVLAMVAFRFSLPRFLTHAFPFRNMPLKPMTLYRGNVWRGYVWLLNPRMCVCVSFVMEAHTLIFTFTLTCDSHGTRIAHLWRIIIIKKGHYIADGSTNNKGKMPAFSQSVESISAHSCQISQHKTKVLGLIFDPVVFGTINQRENFFRDELCAFWGILRSAEWQFRANQSAPSSMVRKSKKNFWILDPIGCPETSVRICHHTLRNIPEDGGS